MILVLGPNGQIGKRICKNLKELNLKYYPLSYRIQGYELRDLINQIKDLEPDLIINCIGYTNVTQAQKDINQAVFINGILPEVLSKISNLIHFSSDYVFDGEKGSSYEETEIPNPINAYGMSKLAGDQGIQSYSNFKYWIFRTSWVFSDDPCSFTTKVIERAKKETLANNDGFVPVVDDQHGVPTSANWIAEIVSKLVVSGLPNPGLYNLTADGQTTWYDFAKTVLGKANPLNKCRILPVKSDHPMFTGVRRPKYSVLNNSKIKGVGVEIKNWDEYL